LDTPSYLSKWNWKKCFLHFIHYSYAYYDLSQFSVYKFSL